MKVICCYSSDVNPLTRQALSLYASDVEYVETKGLFGYNKAIESRWTGNTDLVVIEQDKEITADVIPSFDDCNKPWCMYTYFNFPEPYTRECLVGLGCAKFSAELQQLVSPSEFLTGDSDWIQCPLCNGAGCWQNLDSRIAFAIMNHQIAPHYHGKIAHHHDYPPDWAKQRGLE